MILLTTYNKTNTRNQQHTISILEDYHLPLATQDYFSYSFKVIYINKWIANWMEFF